MTPDKDQPSQDDRTVLEKDLAGVADGLGFVFKMFGFVAEAVGKADKEFDQECIDRKKDHICPSPDISDPNHPDYPSAANPRWKL